MTFTGQVKAGKILLDAPMAWKGYLGTVESGKRVTVTVSPVKRTRSLPQNAYLWGVVYPMIAKEIGYTVNEFHYAMKFKFLRRGDEQFGDLVRVGSTAKLSTKEFSDYVDLVRQLGAENGIVVPDPE